MTNLQAAAEEYAQRKQAQYVAKRGDRVPARAAFDVYMWAFNRFVNNAEVEG